MNVRFAFLRPLALLAMFALPTLCSSPAYAQANSQSVTSAPSSPNRYPDLPSEIPDKFDPVTSSFNYEKHDVMIPMRDGVKLHAIIAVPKGAKNAPILLERTPYEASKFFEHSSSSYLSMILSGWADVVVDGGYIRVVEDVRGKYGSEGDYLMNRPLHGPLNPTPVDHATDTYDTIDWLVKNLPESNGKVGVIGISYDGFTTLMAMFNPHPALKVVAPMNPMVDGWRGDDWFHNGAFRQQMLDYIYAQEGSRSDVYKWWTAYADEYTAFLQTGSAGDMAKSRGMDQLGFWRKISQHPAYDSFWQDQAVDRLLAAQPLKVPVLLVGGLWDQEDIYGAPAVYRAIKPKDKDNTMVFFVLGPWHHGQEAGNGSSLGAIQWGADTALEFRRNILEPFLAQYLKDGAPKADLAPVTAYETGTNKWLRLQSWPSGCSAGCLPQPTKLYLQPGMKLGFDAPQAGSAQYEEYVSDPAKPVPYRARPIVAMYNESSTWKFWLADDQREPSSRTDVLSFVSEKLTEPIKIAGQPMANLVASTNGTDSDWVVKLIDVYPDEYASDAKLGGYEFMVSADIFRGRYRESLETPKAITPDQPLLYKFAMPTVDHVFLPGHRIMVQIQSSWFPLYDRNPQKFVENIFWAKAGDYQRATQRVYHAPGQGSFIELPIVQSR